MRAGGVGKIAAIGKAVQNVAVGDYAYATCGKSLPFSCSPLRSHPS